jgi:LuxR family quorum sensing-dependent transcriptional regulator
MLDRLSRDDLLHVVELSHRCLGASSYEDVQAILTSVGSVTSFDRAALCAASTEDGVSLDHFVNHSFGEAWGNVYTGCEFDRVDPVLSHGRDHCTFHWRDAFVESRSQASALFYEAARDFGFVQGIAFACQARASSARTVLSLATRDGRDLERMMGIAATLGPHLHEAYQRLRQRDRTEPRPGCAVELTSREREILAWTQDGKTYWEIGQIIGISQRTVKYHFTRIKAKLDVVSASHAIAKAMRMGLLE